MNMNLKILDLVGKRLTKGEYFYDVPIEVWHIFNIEGNNGNS